MLALALAVRALLGSLEAHQLQASRSDANRTTAAGDRKSFADRRRPASRCALARSQRMDAAESRIAVAAARPRRRRRGAMERSEQQKVEELAEKLVASFEAGCLNVVVVSWNDGGPPVPGWPKFRASTPF